MKWRWRNIPLQLERIERKLDMLLFMESHMGKELDDLKAAVTAERTVTDSVVVLLTDISARLKDAIASGNPADLATLAADLTANTSRLADAVTANTPTPPGA